MPVSFDEENTIIGPPPKLQDTVETMCVHMGRDTNGMAVVISCWKITKEEMETIQRTGRVWLVVMGELMPPVALTGVSPFNKLEGDDNGPAASDKA